MNLLISFLFAALLAQQTQPARRGVAAAARAGGAAPARYMIGPRIC